MRRCASIAAAAALLAACTTGGSDAVLCDAPVPYSREFQARAAAELDALPPGAALRTMTDDYGELRARIRGACGR